MTDAFNHVTYIFEVLNMQFVFSKIPVKGIITFYSIRLSSFPYQSHIMQDGSSSDSSPVSEKVIIVGNTTTSETTTSETTTSAGVILQFSIY